MRNDAPWWRVTFDGSASMGAPSPSLGRSSSRGDGESRVSVRTGLVTIDRRLHSRLGSYRSHFDRACVPRSLALHARDRKTCGSGWRCAPVVTTLPAMKGTPLCSIAILLALVPTLLAQEGAGADEASIVVSKAKAGLETRVRETQLAAVQELASIPPAKPVELKVVELLNIALGSKHEEVVDAAVDALLACGDRDASIRALVAHLGRVRIHFEQAPVPVWPAPKYKFPVKPKENELQQQIGKLELTK